MRYDVIRKPHHSQKREISAFLIRRAEGAVPLLNARALEKYVFKRMKIIADDDEILTMLVDEANRQSWMGSSVGYRSKRRVRKPRSRSWKQDQGHGEGLINPERLMEGLERFTAGFETMDASAKRNILANILEKAEVLENEIVLHIKNPDMPLSKKRMVKGIL